MTSHSRTHRIPRYLWNTHLYTRARVDHSRGTVWWETIHGTTRHRSSHHAIIHHLLWQLLLRLMRVSDRGYLIHADRRAPYAFPVWGRTLTIGQLTMLLRCDIGPSSDQQIQKKRDNVLLLLAMCYCASPPAAVVAGAAVAMAVVGQADVDRRVAYLQEFVVLLGQASSHLDSRLAAERE